MMQVILHPADHSVSLKFFVFSYSWTNFCNIPPVKRNCLGTSLVIACTTVMYCVVLLMRYVHLRKIASLCK